MSRKEIKIDWAQTEKLCHLQCTIYEIAHWFNCNPQTIENKCLKEQGMLFSGYFKKHSTSGLISLRRNLFKLSENQPGVAIFLAKNYLGMKDTQEVRSVVTQRAEELTDDELAAIASRRSRRTLEAPPGPQSPN